MDKIVLCIKCIPSFHICEDCAGYFSLRIINHHYKNCYYRKNKFEERKRDTKNKKYVDEPCNSCLVNVGLCAVCNGYFPINRYDQHLSGCKNPDLEVDNQHVDDYGYDPYLLADDNNDDNYGQQEVAPNEDNINDFNDDNYNYEDDINYVKPSYGKVKCTQCFIDFEKDTDKEYSIICPDCLLIINTKLSKIECKICKQKVDVDNINEHEEECLKKNKKKNEANKATNVLGNIASAIGSRIKSMYGTKKSDLLTKWNEFSSLKREVGSEYEEMIKTAFKEMAVGYSESLDIVQGHRFGTQPSNGNATLLQRIKSEILFWLKLDLPMNFHSSFFVRASSDRPQFIKFLIAGSRGSPYEHGLFLFDLYIPSDYPNKSPSCNLITTGGGNIRFNPNLYNNGYVCLSLLGTWRGQSIENWDPKCSNLTQLLVSISSIVMNDNIGENEPGWEGLTGSDKGLLENEAYANIVRLGNLQYAMIDMITNPPSCFKDVVEEYFRLKGDEIIEDIKLWPKRNTVAEVTYSGIAGQNNNWCSMLSVKGTYEKKIEEGLAKLTALVKKLKVDYEKKKEKK